VFQLNGALSLPTTTLSVVVTIADAALGIIPLQLIMVMLLMHMLELNIDGQ
jgi:hypothetical protein